MIHHIVALSLVEGYENKELEEIMVGLSQLEIDGFGNFSHGENLDFEAKSVAYSYGFICAFSTRSAALEYASNAEHIKFGARLVTLCKGGSDGIFVMDLKT